jgi:hypothetical protein
VDADERDHHGSDEGNPVHGIRDGFHRLSSRQDTDCRQPRVDTEEGCDPDGDNEDKHEPQTFSGSGIGAMNLCHLAA